MMKQAKVLVADYDAKSLSTLGGWVERAGYHSILVNNGNEALAKVESDQPDLCIIDPMLPGINGFNVSQQIRLKRPKLPIVISTAVYKGEKYQRDAKVKYGVSAYLEKPYSEEQLGQTIASLLQVKAVRQPALDDSVDKKLEFTLNSLASTGRPAKKGERKGLDEDVEKRLEHTLSGLELPLRDPMQSSGSFQRSGSYQRSGGHKTPKVEVHPAFATSVEDAENNQTMRVSPDELKRELEKMKAGPSGISVAAAHGKPAGVEVRVQAPPNLPAEPVRSFSMTDPQGMRNLEEKLTSSDIFGALIDEVEKQTKEELKNRKAPPGTAAVAKPPSAGLPSAGLPTPGPPTAGPPTAGPPSAGPLSPPPPQAIPGQPAQALLKPAPAAPVLGKAAYAPAGKGLEQPAPLAHSAVPGRNEPPRPRLSEAKVQVPAATPTAPTSASQKTNEYQLLSKIASGGMAEVWKARLVGEKGFEKIVAIKKILPHLSDNQEFITMFVDEAKVAANLTHPNIAQIYELGQMDNSFFIAMEYVSGHNLRTILSLCNELNLQLPVEIAVFLAMKLCSALFYAHTKKDYGNRELHIVHRDISPQNILLSNEGEVKLVDFGIAKASIKASHTVAGSLKGKLLYMSPEQAEGKAIDQRSDIFSLGNVLYECLTGRKLIAGDSELSILKNVREARFERPSAYNPRIPAKLEGIVLKALALSVNDRYGTAKEFEKDLKEFVQQAKYHTNESDVADYIRSLFLKDLHLLQQFEAKKVRTQTKPSVIMPDTGMIQAHEQAILGQAPVLPPRSRKRTLPLLLSMAALVLASLAVWWFFLRQPPPVANSDAPPVLGASDGAETTPSPVELDLPLSTPVESESQENSQVTGVEPSAEPTAEPLDPGASDGLEPTAEDPNKDLKERLAKLRQELEQAETNKKAEVKADQKKRQ